ncbi:hypothetical protein C8F01DRAFT_1175034 [Mycena amicta]|nr:hypothetical protein C8F01DRAFT_1175034 [Mycena amicta]
MAHSFTLGRPNSRPGFGEWYSTGGEQAGTDISTTLMPSSSNASMHLFSESTTAEVCRVLRRVFSTAMQTKIPLHWHAMPAGNLPDACAETHGRSRYQLRTFFSFAHCRIPSHIYSAQQSPVDTALPPRVFCGAACTSSLHRHEPHPIYHTLGLPVVAGQLGQTLDCNRDGLGLRLVPKIGGRLFGRLPPFVLPSCTGLSATKRDAQMALTDPPTLCLDTG